MFCKSGYEIAYATYLGGSAWNQAREIIPQKDGSVLVGGMTASSNMPTTPGVVQPQYAGDDPSLGHGGSKTDWPRGGLALDREDNVYLVGGTDSLAGSADAFVVKLVPERE